jgi:hypothetical protein
LERWAILASDFCPFFSLLNSGKWMELGRNGAVGKEV